ncbi:MAG: glutamate--cysteine ligase [Thermoleophilia bacterium]
MGLQIDRDTFDADDEERFALRLRHCLTALDTVLARPGFGEGPTRIGMELELSLVDASGRPLMRNEEVLSACRVPRMAVELDRFNVEYNSLPRPVAGAPFTTLATEVREALTGVGEAAAEYGGRVAAVGILPTLEERDLQRDALTDQPRFRALSSRIRQLRQAPFRVRLDGRELIDITCDDVTLEGANTSLQVHLQVTPAQFARAYNAAQIATGPVLAVCGNSPILAGRLGWEETRVALFRQAVDDRGPTASWRPARVSFGHGWVRNGPAELFAESVALHAPLLPVCGDEDPLWAVGNGHLPELAELRLHHGTVWRWNRAVYDPDGAGSVRLEMRALPAGPTVRDMLANVAFLVGLTAALSREVQWMTAALPFRFAEHNFIQAARAGMDATLLWPAHRAPSPRPVHIGELIHDLLPVADAGLALLDVDPDERRTHLTVIEERVGRGVTGARWQRDTMRAAELRMGRSRGLAHMLDRYLDLAVTDEPVHTWPMPAER